MTALGLAIIGFYFGLPVRGLAQTGTTNNIFNGWISLAISAAGTKIAADSLFGGIETTTNGGLNWTNVGSPGQTAFSTLAFSMTG